MLGAGYSAAVPQFSPGSIRAKTSSPVVLSPPGAAAMLAPIILQPRSTTLYVGKIAPSVSNELIKQLLEACGTVKEWKRMEDPETKALKPFGFCEYEEAEGVIRALNLLNNLAVGGKELLLKCNTQTQKYIDSIEARKAQQLQQAPASNQGFDTGGEEADNQALETIMSLVSSHAPALPPPPSTAAAAADTFLASLKEEADQSARHARYGARDNRNRRRESRTIEEDASAEARIQRERERTRQEAEARQQEQDNAYKSLLRKWETHESDKRKQLDREREHQKDRSKERDRLLKADLEVIENDDEKWRRKLYVGSRRALDRKRRREKENHEDELDKQQEVKEANKKRASQPSEVAPKRLEDMSDGITQAMMSAAKAPRKSPAVTTSQDPPAQKLPGPPTKREAPPPVKPGGKNKAVLAAFGGDDEEEPPKRSLKPIAYSEEEQKAALLSPYKPEDKAAAIDDLISKVPTDLEAVSAYDISWKAYDDGASPLKDKIRSWVSKKTTELLGEEEASMVDFIMAQLQEHASARALLEELQAVLDEEASPFVLKLYRMVIFETLKQSAGLHED